MLGTMQDDMIYKWGNLPMLNWTVCPIMIQLITVSVSFPSHTRIKRFELTNLFAFSHFTSLIMHLTSAYSKVISFKIYMLTDTVRKILSTITQQFSPSSLLILYMKLSVILLNFKVISYLVSLTFIFKRV